MNKNKFLFGKSLRLCSLKRISEVFTTGKTLFSHPFKVFYLPNSTDSSTVLISVPKRSFKKAVDRNRIKRVLRSMLRLKNFSGFLPQGCDICIVYIGKELPLYTKTEEKINYVLEKIKKNCSENPDIPVSDNN